MSQLWKAFSVVYAHRPRACPGFCCNDEASRSVSTPLIEYCSIAGIPRPSSKLTGIHLYTWVERGTLRVKKCLAQEHNKVSLARVRVRTVPSGDERRNYKATTLGMLKLTSEMDVSR